MSDGASVWIKPAFSSDEASSGYLIGDIPSNCVLVCSSCAYVILAPWVELPSVCRIGLWDYSGDAKNSKTVVVEL